PLRGGGGGPPDRGLRETQRGLPCGGVSPERVRDADLRQLQRAGLEPVRGRRLAYRPAPGVGGGRRVRRAAASSRASADRRRSYRHRRVLVRRRGGAPDRVRGAPRRDGDGLVAVRGSRCDLFWPALLS